MRKLIIAALATALLVLPGASALAKPSPPPAFPKSGITATGHRDNVEDTGTCNQTWALDNVDKAYKLTLVSATPSPAKYNLEVKEDGVFTTVEDVAETVRFLAAFPSAALTGQSFVVSHGWFMQ